MAYIKSDKNIMYFLKQRLVSSISLFLVFSLTLHSQDSLNKRALFQGKLPDNCDSIQFVVIPNPIDLTSSGNSATTIFADTLDKKWFKYSSPILEHVGRVLIQVYFKESVFGEFYYIEPGDDIKLTFQANGDKIMFSGRGSAKYNVLTAQDEIFDVRRLHKHLPQIQSTSGLTIQERRTILEDSLRSALGYLKRYSKSISSTVYQMIKNDWVASFYFDPWYLNLLYTVSRIHNNEEKLKLISEAGLITKYDSDTAFANAIIFSPTYMRYLLRVNVFDLVAANQGQNINLVQLFSRLNKRYSGVLRDRLLYELCASPESGVSGINFDRYTLDSLTRVIYYSMNEGYLRDLLVPIVKLTKGEPFYNFSFLNLEGERVTLDNFKGKVVLLDMWSTGCGGCIVFANGFDKDVYPRISDHSKFEVLSVNADATKERWINTLNGVMKSQKQHINVQLNGKDFWSDSLIKYYGIEGLPFTVLIDENGKVLYYNVIPLKSDDLLNIINSAIEKITG